MAHKITQVMPLEGYSLKVVFDNQVAKVYDLTKWLSHPTFAQLKNPSMFRQVSIEPGGYAISWNQDIDLSEHELWQNGKVI